MENTKRDFVCMCVCICVRGEQKESWHHMHLFNKKMDFWITKIGEITHVFARYGVLLQIVFVAWKYECTMFPYIFQPFAYT